MCIYEYSQEGYLSDTPFPLLFLIPRCVACMACRGGWPAVQSQGLNVVYHIAGQVIHMSVNMLCDPGRGSCN